MPTASELMSQNNTNAMMNYRLWGNLTYVVSAYDIFPDGTDVTNKLQALVNLANSQGRTAIFFPPGEYFVTNINNDNNVYYFGDNASFVGGYGKHINQIGSSAQSIVYDVKFFGATGDGTTDDTSAIQSALDAAGSTGGEVVFLPGTYLLTDYLRVSSNTTVRGIGKVVFKRGAASSAMLINKSDGTIGGYLANTNIVIENIEFDGNNTAIPGNVTLLTFGHSSNILIDNCKFYNCASWHEIELNSSQNVIVNRCQFSAYTGTSEVIQLDIAMGATQFPWFGPYDNTACSNIKIQNCAFTGSGTVAVGNHSFVTGAINEFVQIMNNTFLGYGYCINLNDTSNLLVEGNKFTNCQFGVVFSQQQNDVRNWTIVKNTYLGQYSESVEERFFYGVTTSLTRSFVNLKINNNFINNCGSHGVAFTATENVEINGNVIENCGRNGVYFFGGSRGTVANNQCRNNNRSGVVGRADIVIGNISTINILVSNNNVSTIIVGTTTTGIVVTNNIAVNSITNNGGAGGTLKNNLIAGAWTAG